MPSVASCGIALASRVVYMCERVRRFTQLKGFAFFENLCRAMSAAVVFGEDGSDAPNCILYMDTRRLQHRQQRCL